MAKRTVCWIAAALVLIGLLALVLLLAAKGNDLVGNGVRFVRAGGRP